MRPMPADPRAFPVRLAMPGRPGQDRPAGSSVGTDKRFPFTDSSQCPAARPGRSVRGCQSHDRVDPVFRGHRDQGVLPAVGRVLFVGRQRIARAGFLARVILAPKLARVSSGRRRL